MPNKKEGPKKAPKSKPAPKKAPKDSILDPFTGKNSKNYQIVHVPKSARVQVPKGKTNGFVVFKCQYTAISNTIAGIVNDLAPEFKRVPIHVEMQPWTGNDGKERNGFVIYCRTMQ
jgi:hypothetical protein